MNYTDYNNRINDDSIILMPEQPKKTGQNFLGKTFVQLSAKTGKSLMTVSALSQVLILAGFLVEQKEEDPYEEYRQKIAHTIALPLVSLLNVTAFALGKLLTRKNPPTYPKNCEDLYHIFKTAYEVIEEHKTWGKSFFHTNPQVTEACERATAKLKSIESRYYAISAHASKSPSTQTSAKGSLPYTGYLQIVEQAEEAAKKVIVSLAQEIKVLVPK